MSTISDRIYKASIDSTYMRVLNEPIDKDRESL